MRAPRLLWKTVLILAVAVVSGVAQSTVRPPGEEVMQPTQYGVRATPELSRLFARMLCTHAGWVRELGLDTQQRDKMADVIARRMMEQAHANGQQWQQLLEVLFERELVNHGQFDETTGPEMARRFLPLAPAILQFTRDLVDDCRPFLNAEQFQQLDRYWSGERADVEEIEARMKNWAEGKVDKGGRAFESSRPESPESVEVSRRQWREARRKGAMEWAERDLAQYSTQDWSNFVGLCRGFFGWTSSQKHEAEQIMDRYVRQVQVLATDDWKSRVRQNRIRFRLASASDQRDVLQPWIERQRQEYSELTQPVQDLHDAFHREVIALATPEQRAAAYGKVENPAKERGVNDTELQFIKQMLQQAR